MTIHTNRFKYFITPTAPVFEYFLFKIHFFFFNPTGPTGPHSAQRPAAVSAWMRGTMALQLVHWRLQRLHRCLESRVVLKNLKSLRSTRRIGFSSLCISRARHQQPQMQQSRISHRVISRDTSRLFNRVEYFPEAPAVLFTCHGERGSQQHALLEHVDDGLPTGARGVFGFV